MGPLPTSSIRLPTAKVESGGVRGFGRSLLRLAKVLVVL